MRDLEKNSGRLFGNHSKAQRDVTSYLARSISDAQNACGANAGCRARFILNSLKKCEHFRGYLADNFLHRAATNGLFAKAVSMKLPKQPVSANDIKNVANARGIKVKSVQPGILLADGRLVVSLKSGVVSGFLVFATDAGVATYSYAKGDIGNYEYRESLIRAAINGSSVAGGTAVAVLLGANPAGLAVMGVAAGTYLVVDQLQTAWRKYQDQKYVSVAFFQSLGFEINSPLQVDIDPDIPLNAANW